MDVKELHTLSEMNSRIGRMEGAQEANTHAIREMATSVTRLVDKLDKSDDVAKEAYEKSKSAHKRIDGFEEDRKARKARIEWLVKLILTPIILGALGLIWWLILEYTKAKG